YALQTEHLAYEQTMPMGRLLVNWLITKKHLEHLNLKKWEWDQIRDEGPNPENSRPSGMGPKEWANLRQALDDLAEGGEHLPKAIRDYRESIIKPKARKRIN